MKKLCSKILLSGCALAPTLMLCPSLSSCAKASEIKIHIADKYKQQFCYERSFSIPFDTSKLWDDAIAVSIIGSGLDGLTLETTSVTPMLKKGSLKFSISSDVHYDKEFSFSIMFDLSNGKKFDEKYKKTVAGFQIYYLPQHEVVKDEVLPEHRSITNTESWIFNYRFKFSDLPLSNVEPTIIRSDNLLRCDKESYPVVEEEDGYYLTIPIIVDFKTQQDTVAEFDLLLSFTNSFGVEQDEKIYDFVATLNRDDTGTVPESWLDIQQDTETNGYVLNGFRKEIIGKIDINFSLLKIPARVTRIPKNAFPLMYADFLSNIQEVSFEDASCDPIIEQNAFSGLTNLWALDLSMFVTLPTFLVHPVAIFPGNYDHVGFVWYQPSLEINKTKILTLGLFTTGDEYVEGTVWDLWDSNHYTPNEFFKTKKEAGTGSYTLIGVDQLMLQHATNYGVIRLPHGIRKIAPNALSLLSYEPYVDSEGTPRQRRIFFNQEIEVIEGEQAFSKCGFKGDILIPSNLKEIPKLCFEDAGDYNENPGELVQTTSRLFFNPNSKLETISEGAFSQWGYLFGSLVLPNGLKKVGDKILSGTGINELVLPTSLNSEDSVGTESFGGCGMLNVIDISQFGWPFVAFMPWVSTQKNAFKNDTPSTATGILYIGKDWAAEDVSIQTWVSYFFGNLQGLSQSYIVTRK